MCVNIHDFCCLIIATNPHHNECECTVIILHSAMPPFLLPLCVCVHVVVFARVCERGLQLWVSRLGAISNWLSSADWAVAMYYTGKRGKKCDVKERAETEGNEGGVKWWQQCEQLAAGEMVKEYVRKWIRRIKDRRKVCEWKKDVKMWTLWSRGDIHT